MDEPIYQHLLAAVSGLPRILGFVSFTPLFGLQSMPTATLPVAFALYIPLHPYIMSLGQVLPADNFNDVLLMLICVAKEFFIGFLMAYVLMSVLYAVLSAGVIIDNQRGASAAQSAEPLSNAESSPSGSLLFLALVTLFFASGSFIPLLKILYGSYALWSPYEMLPQLMSENTAVFSAIRLTSLMSEAVLLCAPFLITTLLCDAALSLMNRFAPQLNVYVLAMPVKSAVCSLLLIFYLSPFFNAAQELIAFGHEALKELLIINGVSPSALKGLI